MNIDGSKERQPLGYVLVALEDWKRRKIKSKLQALGVTQGQWKGLLTRAEAHKVPAFVRDVIVEELPETASLFNHPDHKPEQVA